MELIIKTKCKTCGIVRYMVQKSLLLTDFEKLTKESCQICGDKLLEVLQVRIKK